MILFKGLTYKTNDGKERWAPIFIIFASDLKFWWSLDGIKGKEKSTYSPFEKKEFANSLIKDFPLCCRSVDNLHASFSILSVALLPVQQYMFELSAQSPSGSEGFVRAMDAFALFGFGREEAAVRKRLADKIEISKANAIGLLDTLNVDAGVAQKVQEQLAKAGFEESESASSALATWMKCNGKTVQLTKDFLVPIMQIMSDPYRVHEEDPIEEVERSNMLKLAALDKRIESAEQLMEKVGIVAIGTGGANSGMTSTTDGLTDEQVDAVSALSKKDRRAFNKYVKLKRKRKALLATVRAVNDESARQEQTNRMSRTANERMDIALKVTAFYRDVLFASSFQGETFEDVRNFIQKSIDDMYDALKVGGYKVESKYYYKYLKTGAADVLAEKWHFFRLDPGALGTQTSEGFNKILKNWFNRRSGLSAGGMGQVVSSVMERINVQQIFFFETVLSGSVEERRDFRCTACGCQGHQRNNKICPQFVHSGANSGTDSATTIERRARLISYYKIKTRVAGRLRFHMEDAGSLTRVHVKYVEDDDEEISLNTGGNHISYAVSDLGDKAVQLTSMHIDRQYQRKGYGTLILAALHSKWYELGYRKCIITNESSIGRVFYRNLGYQKDVTGNYVFQI